MKRHYFQFEHEDVVYKDATAHKRMMEIAEKFEAYVKVKSASILSVDQLPAIPLFVYPNTFYKMPRIIQQVYKHDARSKLYYLISSSDMTGLKVTDEYELHTVKVIW